MLPLHKCIFPSIYFQLLLNTSLFDDLFLQQYISQRVSRVKEAFTYFVIVMKKRFMLKRIINQHFGGVIKHRPNADILCLKLSYMENMVSPLHFAANTLFMKSAML